MLVRADSRGRAWILQTAIGLAISWVVGGCAEPDEPGLGPGECRAVLWGIPERTGNALFVVGSWNDWGEPIEMVPFEQEEPWWVADFALPSGDYGYLVVEEQRGRLDAFNPLTTFRTSDDLEVSWLRVPDCGRPRLEVSESTREDGTLRWSLDVTPARDGTSIDPESLSLRGLKAEPREVRTELTEGGALELEILGLPRGRHPFVLEGRDAKGAPLPPRRLVAWSEPVAQSPEDMIIYQIMIDRFAGDGGAPLEPPESPGGRAGGTLDGVRAAIESGALESMGVSHLWLSPVYLNPDEARLGQDGNLYEGYHGYWAVDSRSVDPRIGGEGALEALVSSAHERGIGILLDLVPNHVYETNPRVAQGGADWFHQHEPQCVCGTPSCPWSAYILTCWFTPYLPDFRFQEPEVMELAVDDALWWTERFGIDGFRVDAVPMMPRAVTRRIVDALRSFEGGRASTFSLGEIFTGPGPGGMATIRYHLGPAGLDSAFDFPLMWALRSAIAHDGPGFIEVERTLQQNSEAVRESGSILARMIDNHDVTRFASEAQGDAGADPWGDATAIQPIDPDVYARQALALGAILTLPGVPVLYYGDEVGLAGGADPDNRRVMPDDRVLLDAQLELRAFVQRVSTLRRCLPALRRGRRVPFLSSDDRWGFVRDAGDGRSAIVLFNRSSTPKQIELRPDLEGVGVERGWYKDVLTGERFALEGAPVFVDLESRSLRILIPEDDECG